MSKTRSPFWALCRRERLEHRGALIWTPLAAAALFVVATLLFAVLSPDRVIDAGALGSASEGLSPPRLITEQLASILGTIARPFIWLYVGVTGFLLLGTLIDERKDRTILFWKSMPISDTQVVLSKLVVLVGVGALISVAFILLVQLYTVLMVLFYAPNSWGTNEDIWSYAALDKSSVQWLAGYATQVFWFWPLWGWLLLVSSTAPRLPILWAVFVPIVLVVIESVAFYSGYLVKVAERNDSGYLSTAINSHLSLVALSGPSGYPSYSYSGAMEHLASLWTSPGMWLGIATGSLFIVLAIIFRRRNNEL